MKYKIKFTIFLSTLLFVVFVNDNAFGLDSSWRHDRSSFVPLMNKETRTGKPIILYFYTDW